MKKKKKKRISITYRVNPQLAIILNEENLAVCTRNDVYARHANLTQAIFKKFSNNQTL